MLNCCIQRIPVHSIMKPHVNVCFTKMLKRHRQKSIYYYKFGFLYGYYSLIKLGLSANLISQHLTRQFITTWKIGSLSFAWNTAQGEWRYLSVLSKTRRKVPTTERHSNSVYCCQAWGIKVNFLEKCAGNVLNVHPRHGRTQGTWERSSSDLTGKTERALLSQ